MNELLGQLVDVRWDDLDDVAHATTAALHTLVEQPTLLSNALAELPQRPELAALCEHYDLLDKIVLYDEGGIRLRLHIFLPGHFDRPHNHRWSYTSLILRGSYRHYLYGADECLDEDVDPSALRPLLVRHETRGSSYTLDHGMVHAVVAEPYTVSLVVRGPAVKDRFMVMDRTTGASWWQYGAANETTDQAQAKRMSPQYLSTTIDNLTTCGVLDDQGPGSTEISAVGHE